MYPDWRCRGRSDRVLLPPIQDWRWRWRSSFRLEFPVLGGVYSGGRIGKHIGVPRGGVGQAAPQRDELLPAVASGCRSPRQPPRHAAGRHTRIAWWARNSKFSHVVLQLVRFSLLSKRTYHTDTCVNSSHVMGILVNFERVSFITH